MEKLRELLKQYRTAGDAFAEAVKDDIVHGRVSNDVVLKLNAFVIAMNELEDFPLDFDTNEPTTLN
jgi:hypothetical protein